MKATIRESEGLTMVITCKGCGTLYDTDKWDCCRQCKTRPSVIPSTDLLGALPIKACWWRESYGRHHSNFLGAIASAPDSWQCAKRRLT